MADEVLDGEVRFEYGQVVAGFEKLSETIGKFGDEAQRGLDGLADQFTKFSEGADKAFGQVQEARIEALSSKMQELGKSGLSALSSFVEPAVAFQAEIANVNAIAKLSDEQLASFSERVRTLGREIGVTVSPVKAAAAAYDVIGAGFSNAAQSEQVLSAAIKASKAGRAELTEGTDLLTTVLNSYHLEADKAAVVSDKLLRTVDLGKTTFPDLAQSLGLVASTAAESGVSLDELSGVMALATANGIKTSSAAEGLRSLIGNLVKPSKEAQTEMAALGLQIDGATLKSKGLVSTLREVATATQGNTRALATIFADASGRTLAQSLIGDDTGAKLAEFVGQIRNAAGATDEALKRQGASAKAARDEFNAAFEAFQIGASQKALPALTAVFKAGTDVLGVLDGIPGPIKTAGLAFVGLASGVTLLGGALLGLQIGLPFALGQLQLLGGQIGVGAARAIALLGTNVTTAGIATKVTAAATAAADLAYAGFANTVNGLALTFGVAGDALAATVLGWGALGVATVAAADAYAKVSKEVDDANDKLVSAGASLVEYNKRATQSTGDLLTKSSEDLLKAGASLVDFSQRISQVRDELARLKAEKEATIGPDSNGTLGTGGPDQSGAGIGGDVVGLAPGLEEQTKKTEAELAALRKKRDEFAALSEEQKAQDRIRQQQEEARAAAQRKFDQDYIKGQKDRFANELLDIELSKRSHSEKIQLLTNLLNVEAQTDEQRRTLRRKIFDEQEKADKEATSAIKDERDLAIKSSLEQVDASKRSSEEKIRGYRAIIAAFGLVGEAQLAVIRKIDAEEAKAAKASEDRIKRLEELRKESSQKRTEAAQDQLQELQRQQERGIDTGGQQADVVKSEADRRKRELQENLKRDLGKDENSSADVQKQLRKNAADDIAKVERDAARQLREISDKTTKDSLSDQEDQVRAQVDFTRRKIDLYKEEVEAGRGSQFQLMQAIRQKLDLQEEEIRLQAEIQKQATDSPLKQARIEQDAQGRIIDARRAARKEIDEATKAIQRQQEVKKRDTESGGGKILNIQDAFKDLTESFGIDAVRKQADAAAAYNRAPNGSIPSDLTDRALRLQRLGQIQPDAVQYASSRSAAFQDVLGDRTTAPKVDLGGTLTLVLKDAAGRSVDAAIESVTTNGRNSPLEFQLQRLSSR